MMAEYVNRGETVEYTATAAVKRGDVINIGGCFGVAFTDIAADAVGIVNITGRYTVHAATGTAISAGAALFWDASNKCVTTTSTSNTRIGVAANSMASGGASVDVILNA